MQHNDIETALTTIKNQSELAEIERIEAEEARKKAERDKRKEELKQQQESLAKAQAQQSKYDLTSPNKALLQACQQGDIEAIKSLLENGADIHFSKYGIAPEHARNSKEWNDNPLAGDAIHNAIRGDQPEALLFLIKHLADKLHAQMNKINGWGHRLAGDYDIEFADVDINALASQIAGVVNLAHDNRHTLIERREVKLSCIMTRKNSLLIEAVLANSEKCVAMLLQQFAKAEYRRVVSHEYLRDNFRGRYLDGSTLLVIGENEECTVHFGHQNSKVLRGSEASDLLKEVAAKSKEIDDSCYRYGEKISNDAALINKITELCGCTYHDNLVKYSIVVSGDMNSYTFQKGDALTLAIDLGVTNIAKLLIESGCNLEEKYGNKEKKYYEFSSMWSPSPAYLAWDRERDLTPLLVAATKNNQEIVSLLLEKGANIEACDRDGKTALALATDPAVPALIRDHLPLSARFDLLHINVPSEFICPLSKKVFSDPVRYHGIAYDREAYLMLNASKSDNKKVDPNGKTIDKKTYQTILSTPTDEQLLDQIKAYLCREEAKYDAPHSAANSLKRQ